MTATAIAQVIIKGCCLIVGLANESQLDGLLEALTVTLQGVRPKKESSGENYV